MFTARPFAAPMPLISPRLLRFRTALLFVLLALWVPATSHTFLHLVGAIHHQHTDGSPDQDPSDHNHDAADGVFQVSTAGDELLQGQATISLPPSLAFSAWAGWSARENIPARTLPSLYNPSPPEVAVGWQFAQRAALPVRAPSPGAV